MDNVKIGKLIAKCRRDKKKTQKELAELLGVTDKSVSKWENGVCLPDVSLYMELCDILGITLNEFFLGEKIEDKDFKKQADENLLKALESSTFTLEEKIQYYKKKWKKDHRFSLTLGMIIILGLLFFFKDNMDILLIIIIGSFIWSVSINNRMMTYVENHAYKRIDD